MDQGSRKQAFFWSIAGFVGGAIVSLLVLHPEPTPIPTQPVKSSAASSNLSRASALITNIVTPLTLSELENRIAHALVLWPQKRRENEFDRIAAEVDFSQIPAALKLLQGRREYDVERIFDLLIARWAGHDPVGALDYAKSIPARGKKHRAISVGLNVWAKLDAPATAHWFSEAPAEFKADGGAVAAAAIIRGLAASDFEHALTFLEETRLPADDSSRFMLFSMWAESDPAAAAAVLARKSSGVNDLMASTIARAWAERNLDQARQWVESLPPSAMRASALQSIVEAWTRKDPEAAAKFVLNQPMSAAQDRLFAAIAREWSRTDPRAAAQWASQLPDQRARSEAILHAAEEWARTDPQGAASCLPMIQDQMRRRMLSTTIAGHWIREDPKAAAAWAKDLPAEFQADALRMALQELAKVDAKEAGAIALSLPNEQSKAAVIPNLAGNWARQDPAAALGWFKDLPENNTKQSTYREIIAAWAEADPKAAAEFVVRDTSNVSKSDAMQLAVKQWARNTPQQAAIWAANVTDKSIRHIAVKEALSEWGAVSVHDAAQFVASLPAGETQRQAAKEILWQWARFDAAAAAGWASQFPEGAARDDAVSTVAPWIGQTAPEKALSWLSSIQDSDKRFQISEEIARAWLQRAGGEARKWIEQSDLPPATKQKLLE